MRLLCKVERRMCPHKGADNIIDRSILLLPLMSRVEDPLLHRRWGSGPEEEGPRGGSGRRPVKEDPDSQGPGVGDGDESPTGAARRSRRSQLASAQDLAVSVDLL